MPLDSFQEEILKLIAANRTADSHIAGGSALHAHGIRLSGDVDIFNAPHVDVPITARNDIEALRRGGLNAEIAREREGFVEADVFHEEFGSTRLQWVQHSANNFYPPVADETFGVRLHIVDLAVNKMVAAASRREPRDFVDLYFIDKHIMPLWTLAWAAPGKDEAFTPAGYLDRVSAQHQYRGKEIEESVDLAPGVVGTDIIRSVREALDKARIVLPKLPQNTAGLLLVDDETKGPITGPDYFARGRKWTTLSTETSKPWPQGPIIDGLLIQRVIKANGLKGERAWTEPRQPSAPEKDDDGYGF
jgi:hypothetical protein